MKLFKMFALAATSLALALPSSANAQNYNPTGGRHIPTSQPKPADVDRCVPMEGMRNGMHEHFTWVPLRFPNGVSYWVPRSLIAEGRGCPDKAKPVIDAKVHVYPSLASQLALNNGRWRIGCGTDGVGYPIDGNNVAYRRPDIRCRSSN